MWDEGRTGYKCVDRTEVAVLRKTVCIQGWNLPQNAILYIKDWGTFVPVSIISGADFSRDITIITVGTVETKTFTFPGTVRMV